MHPSLLAWLFAQAVSRAGDWLFIVGSSWLIIEVLNLQSWHNGVRGAVVAALSLFVSLCIPHPKKLSSRAMVLLNLSVVALCSLTISLLCASSMISFPALLLLAATSAVFGVLSAPSLSYFRRGLFGPDQHRVTALQEALLWGVRFGAGFLVASALIRGSSMLFFLDALSYLPLMFVVAVVSLRYQEAEEEAIGLQASVKDGFWYTWNNRQLRFLLILSKLQSCFVSVVFLLAAEMVKSTHKGKLLDYGLLLTFTGLAGLLGNTVSYRLASCSAKTKRTWYLVSTLLTPVAVIGIGLSSNLPLVIAWYCFYCFILAPAYVLTEAELLRIPAMELGSIVKFRTCFAQAFLPMFWLLVAALGPLLHLPAHTVATTSAAVGLVLTLGVLVCCDQKIRDGMFESDNAGPSRESCS